MMAMEQQTIQPQSTPTRATSATRSAVISMPKSTGAVTPGSRVAVP